MNQLIEEARRISAEIKSNECQHAMAWQAFLDADDSKNDAFEEELDRLELRLQHLEQVQKHILVEMVINAAETGLETVLQALTI